MGCRPLLALVGALVLAGCGAPDDSAVALADPGRERFAGEAGPLLARRCGDVGCHGNRERPYVLYAPGRLRLGDARGSVLSAAELEANYRATLGFLDADRPAETTLLRKALSSGGPGAHKGGAIFEAPSDPECRALARWITGAEQ